MKYLKRFNESTKDEFGDENNWFIETDNKMVAAYEYLKDAFEFVFDNYYQIDPDDVYDFMNDTQSMQEKLGGEGIDFDEDVIICVDDFLSSYGYGEPDNMDDYDQGELDEYCAEFFRVLQKYFDPTDLRPTPRIIKKDKVQ